MADCCYLINNFSRSGGNQNWGHATQTWAYPFPIALGSQKKIPSPTKTLLASTDAKASTIHDVVSP